MRLPKAQVNHKGLRFGSTGEAKDRLATGRAEPPCFEPGSVERLDAVAGCSSPGSSAPWLLLEASVAEEALG